MKLSKQLLLGIKITNELQDDILHFVKEFLTRKGAKGYIVTPNPEIIVYSQSNPGFKKILNDADIALADGVGVMWAGKLLGKPFVERITGTDFMAELIRVASERGYTVGLLGGFNHVALKTAKFFQKKYPKLSLIVLGEDLSEKEIFEIGKKKKIDLLFVAYGFPKQEEWIAKNLSYINVGLVMTVGGAFDYYSQEVKRAPDVWRNNGFEWLYRLIRQPKRFVRQLKLITFVWLVLKQKYLVAEKD